MTYRSRINLGVAAVVMAVGLIFALEAWRINPASYEAVGPRFVPMFLSVTMIVLGAMIGLQAGFGTDIAVDDPDDGFGFRDSALGSVFAVAAAGAVYAAAFWAFGYMAATALGMALALYIFGVRNPVTVLVTALVAAVAYQFVFMGLMGLLDPRGALVDLRFLSHIVTPGS